jgi:TolB-like protein
MLRSGRSASVISEQTVEYMARGVFEMLLDDPLFSIELVDAQNCKIVWSSATQELLEARIKECFEICQTTDLE